VPGISEIGDEGIIMVGIGDAATGVITIVEPQGAALPWARPE
jgi:hypothetical protein